MRGNDSVAKRGNMAEFAGQNTRFNHLCWRRYGRAAGRVENASTEPVLNAIIGELALQLAPLGADVRAAHVWSERNKTCDALSRLRHGEQPKLPLLREAVRVRRPLTPRKLLDSLLP